MSVHQEIKKHGKKAVATIFQELKQLDDGAMSGKPVIEPIPFEELTTKDKEAILEAVNLMKEKRTRQLKGLIYANGSRQRRFVKDGKDFTFVTASLESILTSLVIDDW